MTGRPTRTHAATAATAATAGTAASAAGPADPVRRLGRQLGTRPRTAAAATVALSGLGGAALALAGSGWGSSRPSWLGASDTPLGVTRVGPGLSHAVTVSGLVAVVSAWLAVGLLLAGRRAGARAVLGVLLAGSLPLLAGPPLFSTDARTYVAIGHLVDAGGDPYRQGWGAAALPAYAGRAGATWQHQPSPYSPLALRTLQGVAHLAGGDLDRGALLLRGLVVLALAASAVLLVRLARGTGVPVAGALWLGVANPVVLLGAVSGVHLDALVTPLLLAAVLLLRTGHPVWTGVVVAGAAQLKVTAVVLAAVVAAWAVLRSRTARSTRAAVLVTVSTGAAFAAVSRVCGLGWGWARHLDVPSLAHSAATPVDAVWDLLARAGLVRHVGAEVTSGAPSSVRLAAVVLAGALCVALVVSAPPSDVAATAGWALVTVTLLSGAYWSWYLVPAVALVATARPGPGRDLTHGGMVLLCVAGLLPLAPSVHVQTALSPAFYDVGNLAVDLLALAVVVRGLRAGRRSTPPRPVLEPA